ncbi:hypothetical protein MtrunA17_Chr7g0254741 [Medicago truncatula]|uniref:Uncharacterized protein n=1 Tax=Medicago truncatula TaxID=3880 RepID=A0A396H2P2_MEDTR|nr:hypothetical protein MtrunA17_Chr7g0254741 [Medicago truncatula]
MEQDMEKGEDGFFKKERKGLILWVDDHGSETKKKVSFHVHTLRKLQYHYNLAVDNSNQTFEHVWLEKEKTEDGERFVHPLVRSLCSISSKLFFYALHVCLFIIKN